MNLNNGKLPFGEEQTQLECEGECIEHMHQSSNMNQMVSNKNGITGMVNVLVNSVSGIQDIMNDSGQVSQGQEVPCHLFQAPICMGSMARHSHLGMHGGNTWWWNRTNIGNNVVCATPPWE